METMTDKQLETITLLKNTYLKYAPNGYFNFKKACLGADIHIYIGMIADIKECSNGIRENDIGYGIFTLSYDIDGLKLEKNYHSLSCIPTEQFYAMSHRKVSYRLIKALNPESLAVKWDIYLNRFFSMVKNEINLKNIYNQNNYPKYLSL